MMQQDTKKCELCAGNIMTKCFDIHTRACAKKMSKSSVKISSIKSNPLDLIPCSQCGQMVDFSIYTFHMEECVGRQLTKCPNCKILYPTFLIQEHLNVCNQFKQEPEAQQQQFIEDIEDDFAFGQMIMHLARNDSKDNSEPLKIEAINKIKKHMLNKSQQCSICYCQITKNSVIMKLNCPHKYHTRCLSVWLQKNPHCPMCRRHALH